MKFFATLFLTLAVLTSVHAGERTIKTRDGKVYLKAEITEIGAAAVKISYEGGIVTVPSENLPADIQKEIGYKTLASRQVESGRAEGQKQIDDTIASEGRDEALKAAKEKQLKDAFYAIKSASPAEANAFLALTREAMLEKLGEPIRTVHTDVPGGGFTTFFYDERKPTQTSFVIRDGETAITRGTYKGVPISAPRR